MPQCFAEQPVPASPPPLPVGTGSGALGGLREGAGPPKRVRPLGAEPPKQPRKQGRKETRDIKKKQWAQETISNLCKEFRVELAVDGGGCNDWQLRIQNLEECLRGRMCCGERREALQGAKEVLSPKRPPNCFHRPDIREAVHKARVAHYAVGKYLGDFEYVWSRVPSSVDKLDRRQCLGIQNNYGVQVLAIERPYDGTMQWFPHVQTQFHPDDIVYFAAVHEEDDGRMPYPEGFENFKTTIVMAPYEVEEFDMLELTGYDDDGRPLGVPLHLDNCIIGIESQRASPGQGALCLRNTFGNLAIHLIRRGPRAGRPRQRIRFPGPGDVLEYRDKIYMIYQKVSGDGTQVNPVLQSAVGLAQKLMDRESFHAHVNQVNPTREPGLKVKIAEDRSESFHAHVQRVNAKRAYENPGTDSDY